MVLTHRILSAYVLLTFLATATPIPISLQLLPRSLPELHSDPLLTLELAVSSSLAPGGQARDTSEAMRHISPHNSQMFPQEARTAIIERRMEGSEDSFGKLHESGSLEFFFPLFRKVKDYTTVKQATEMEIAMTLQKIARHLPDILVPSVTRDVYLLLMDQRVRLKEIIGGWPLILASETSPEQKIAVEAIHDWEKQLESWTKDVKLEKGQHFLPLSKKPLEGILLCILQTEDKPPESMYTFLKTMLSPLPNTVLKMTIDDFRKSHEALVEVAQHVQNKWISTWGPDVGKMSEDQRIVIAKLEQLKKYDLVFNSGFTSSTVSNTVAT